MAETTDNLKLWDSVSSTDPAITKQVTQRGGFTAICAQSQIKRATELWGPYGGAWGVKDCKYVELGPDKNGIALSATFFCPVSEFQIASDMEYKPRDDCYKKLLTDVTTKALSKLGFNSDVFEGKFDDNKYVEGRKAEEAAKNGQQTDKDTKPGPPPEPDPPLNYKREWAEGVAAIVGTKVVLSATQWNALAGIISTSPFAVKFRTESKMPDAIKLSVGSWAIEPVDSEEWHSLKIVVRTYADKKTLSEYIDKVVQSGTKTGAA